MRCSNLACPCLPFVLEKTGPLPSPSPSGCHHHHTTPGPHTDTTAQPCRVVVSAHSLIPHPQHPHPYPRTRPHAQPPKPHAARPPHPHPPQRSLSTTAWSPGRRVIPTYLTYKGDHQPLGALASRSDRDRHRLQPGQLTDKSPAAPATLLSGTSHCAWPPPFSSHSHIREINSKHLFARRAAGLHSCRSH